MNFQQFCSAHGLIVTHPIQDEKWHRVPTTDKAHKKNGSYKYLGSVGWAQNYATMAGTEMWRAEGDNKIKPIDQQAINEAQARQARKLTEQYAQARTRAARAVSASRPAIHKYLERKGFPKEFMLVADDIAGKDIVYDGVMEQSGLAYKNLLIIQMRDCVDYFRINSLQLIDESGKKIFLPGGKAMHSVHILGETKDPRYRWFVEGFATGLSIRAALHVMSFKAEVVVCFSAGNMEKVVEQYRKVAKKPNVGYVFADNDKPNEEFPERGEVGQKTAMRIGLPWAVSPTTGYDANDQHQKNGIHSLTALIRKVYAENDD